jgi:glycosyl hydrolase family 99
MPLLGAYDSRDAATIERHAQWMIDAGVGAINVSWWGRGSYEDRAVHLVMDVMRAHGIHVSFHLEPYADDRASSYASDILYLVREYGERRHWDAFLLLSNADGNVGPVFKSFFTSAPREFTDCHGVTQPMPNYTADDVWRRQTDLVRNELRRDFDHITLLSDSLEAGRTLACGFDGTAIYNNYVAPVTWRQYAQEFTASNLVFSFNVNPGFDAVVPKDIVPDSCYSPPKFEPPTRALNFADRRDRAMAMSLGQRRISECFRTTIALQTDAALVNRRRGFVIVYVNSFNEWHEGHQFEPMKDFAALSPAERKAGYHNVDDGSYRLNLVKASIGQAI